MINHLGKEKEIQRWFAVKSKHMKEWIESRPFV